MNKELYKLPDLPYAYDALEPYISKETMVLHHDKHHLAYINGANSALEKIWKSREENTEIDYKSVLRTLAFNAGGHLLHEIFWKILAPKDSGKNQPMGEILKQIEKDFKSFERFKTEFSETAKSVEGSGWAALAFHKDHGNLAIIQIEKHNVNLYPEQKILLCLDVWEHAYYVDYKNDRPKFIENWWNLVNWDEAGRRMSL